MTYQKAKGPTDVGLLLKQAAFVLFPVQSEAFHPYGRAVATGPRAAASFKGQTQALARPSGFGNLN